MIIQQALTHHLNTFDHVWSHLNISCLKRVIYLPDNELRDLLEFLESRKVHLYDIFRAVELN
jgi:hypothetical protein